jgi:ABC-2 type transport system ATP-binding protein
MRASTLATPGLAAVVLVLADPGTTARAAPLASLAAGAGVAGALFSGLARRAPTLRVPADRRLAIGVKGGYLTVRAASEEVIWRWWLLGSLDTAIGGLAALGVSTACFALTHARTQGLRGVAVHLVTGAAFGTVFLATGRLAAAVAAHAAYNLLVALAVESEAARRRALRPPPLPADHLPASLEVVSKRFGATQALREVDLEVRAGEVVALLGPNGAGKTTAVAILLGLRRPDSGRARLFGRDPRVAETRRRVGATPQESGLSPTLTVREIVDFVRAHYPAPAPAAEIADRFGLRDLERRQAGGLSGGQRRRLAVALAFAGDPDAVFLDEPTAGLDVASRRGVWDAVSEFAARGRSVFLTTHNLEEAEALATRVVVVSRGRVVADATVPELKARAGLKRIRLPEQQLPTLPGVVQSRVEGERHVLYVEDAGAVVRQLVLANASLDGVEILPVSLEEAFLAVTEAAE